jgi:hypothetical protein
MNRHHAVLVALVSASMALGTSAAHARDPEESKVLEITTIEGQILFPKVLFISAEDQARYPETLHRSYLRTALELANSAPLPKTICATEPGDAISPANANIPASIPPPDPADAHPPTNSQEVNP